MRGERWGSDHMFIENNFAFHTSREINFAIHGAWKLAAVFCHSWLKEIIVHRFIGN